MINKAFPCQMATPSFRNFQNVAFFSCHDCIIYLYIVAGNPTDPDEEEHDRILGQHLH